MLCLQTQQEAVVTFSQARGYLPTLGLYRLILPREQRHVRVV